MRNRPLSPHLQIYKPQLTSVLSILHRITGFGLSVAAILLTFFLVCLMSGSEAFSMATGFLRSVMGLVLVFGCVFAGSFHFLNGIRHLYWDMGKGLGLKSVYTSGWITVLGSLVLASLILGIVVCHL